MSAHLDRARLLLAQSRSADAERETLLALAAQPSDPAALALLALIRADLKKNDEALSAARTAIGLGPDDPYLHFVHAYVLHQIGRENEAFAAVQEALRLAPEEEENFSLLASIELTRRNWPAALAAAEQALALNPEHVNAANLRSMALVRLGRKEEATATVDYALNRAPENAFSHANQGWNCLHRNDPKQAQDHFREALRLDPTLDYARDGMLEALKARNPIYRGMLAYFLWMSSLSEKLQWAFIIGIFFGGRMIRTLAERQPELGWVLWPVLGLFYAFIYLSWTAMPMFNLLLRFNRFGRHVLTRDQRIATNWFGPFFLAALGMLIWWLTTDNGLAMLLTFYFTFLSLCIAATFVRTGRPRLILGLATGALAAAGAGAIVMLAVNKEVGQSLVTVFIFGFLGFQILANTLRGK
jgi:Flp pilus assembly protein TadD